MRRGGPGECLVCELEKIIMTIKDLHPREPVGAVVSVGVKDKAKGFPTETDRWHIVQPREENGIRHPHPAFTSFNQAPPEHRKVLKGVIMHATRDLCVEWHLKAQVLSKAHPDRRPACVGDGVKAIRWEGGEADDFMDIKCPTDLEIWVSAAHAAG